MSGIGRNKDRIRGILKKDWIDQGDFRELLSEEAGVVLEDMALRARKLSLNHFGRAVILYTPIYISNYCINRCLYCSFNTCNGIKRIKLDEDGIRKEAQVVSRTGVEHVLLLTGESPTHTDVHYIIRAVRILKEYFASVVLEIYPMEREDYERLVHEGIDGITLYQETYDREVYERVHVKGPKRDYDYRLNAPERACSAGIRTINMGALLGLTDWREDVFKLGLHIKEICSRFPEVEVGISLPRIKGIDSTETIGYKLNEVDDRELVQILCALRIFLPHCSINISTREEPYMRRNLLHIGVNKMSAGVSTEVGGYSGKDSADSQFEISDLSSVEEIMKMLHEEGYQGVLKDWVGYD